MKVWLLSDLHLEFADLRQPLAIPEADVCVMAGDLCRAPANGVHWLAILSFHPPASGRDRLVLEATASDLPARP